MKSISAAIVVLAGAIVYTSSVVAGALEHTNRDAEGFGMLVGFVGGVVWIAMLLLPSRDREA